MLGAPIGQYIAVRQAIGLWNSDRSIALSWFPGHKGTSYVLTRESRWRWANPNGIVAVCNGSGSRRQFSRGRASPQPYIVSWIWALPNNPMPAQHRRIETCKVSTTSEDDVYPQSRVLESARVTRIHAKVVDRNEQARLLLHI
jgi:hypothetical protein